MGVSAVLVGEARVGTRDLYARFSELRPFRRKWSFLAGGVAAAAAVALTSGPLALGDWTPFFGAVAGFLALLFLVPLVLAWRALSAMHQRTIRYEVERDQIAIAGNGSSITRPWNDVVQFREARHAFFIWFGRYRVHVVLKRAFSLEGVDLIREILHTKVKPSPRWSWWNVLVWLLIVLGFLAMWHRLYGIESIGERLRMAIESAAGPHFARSC